MPPILSKPSGAAPASLFYITLGALMTVWSGIWYSYLRNHAADATRAFITSAWGSWLTGHRPAGDRLHPRPDLPVVAARRASARRGHSDRGPERPEHHGPPRLNRPSGNDEQARGIDPRAFSWS